MKSLLAQLLGGRPMKREGFAFVDDVSHEVVHYYRDQFGRRWLATTRWALFRVPVTSEVTRMTREQEAQEANSRG